MTPPSMTPQSSTPPSIAPSIAPSLRSLRSVPQQHYSKAALAIDWAQLYQISDGNQEFEVELIKLFFVETKTLLTNLSGAIGAQNMQHVEHIAHQIKGSSGNIGFRSMSAIADQLERQARQQNLTSASRYLQELTQWILEIQKFLE
jgi:histidine phosphotransfer protein HptB